MALESVDFRGTLHEAFLDLRDRMFTARNPSKLKWAKCLGGQRRAHLKRGHAPALHDNTVVQQLASEWYNKLGLSGVNGGCDMQYPRSAQVET